MYTKLLLALKTFYEITYDPFYCYYMYSIDYPAII